MAEKIIKTKIALRWLDYATWSTEAFKAEKPLKGEVWFCEVPTGNANAQTAPTMLFKVGDGVNTFGALKWASALAADVYGWAKKEHLDVNDLPTLPINVVDTEDGKFVTDFEYANNTLTIHRADAVNSLAVNDDDVVVLSVDKSTGDVTVTGEHAKKGPANGYTGGQATEEINAFGDSITIKVPKLSVDAYGHTNTAEDVEYKITLPTPEAATNTVTTLEEGDGIDIEELATDGNHRYKISHEDTSDIVNVTKEARKYVAGVTFDGFGHVTAVEMGEETDQPIPEYNIVKDTTSEYAATYRLTKDGVNVGAAINIPKDMVVEKGEVKELEAGTWGEAGTYIIVTLANATDDKLYINVGNLIEYVTGGTTADIIVSVDETTHVVTATLTQTVKDDIAKGVAAKAVTDNLKGLAFQDKIDNTDIDDNTIAIAKLNGFDTAVAAIKVTNAGNADTLGNHGADYFATAERVKALEDAKHINKVEADTGLKVVKGSTNEDNKVAIDTDVVFILDCNW